MSSENEKSPKRILILSETIEPETAEYIMYRIALINEFDAIQVNTQKNYDREPIKLYINTTGGDLYSTLAIVSAIENSTTEVHGYIYGLCASGGIYITAACQYKAATKYAQFMIHDMKWGGYANRIAMRESLEQSDIEAEVLANILLEKTKITKEQLEEMITERKNWWISPTLASELGLIDEVI